MPTPKLQQQNKASGGGVIPPAPNAIPPKVVEMAQQNFAMRNGGELPPSMQGSPNGNVPPVASVPNVDYFGQGGRLQGAFDYTPSTPAPAPEYGTQGVQFTNPANPQQNDLNSLSQALANAGVSRHHSSRQTQISVTVASLIGLAAYSRRNVRVCVRERPLTTMTAE